MIFIGVAFLFVGYSFAKLAHNKGKNVIVWILGGLASFFIPYYLVLEIVVYVLSLFESITFEYGIMAGIFALAGGLLSQNYLYKRLNNVGSDAIDGSDILDDIEK